LAEANFTRDLPALLRDVARQAMAAAYRTG
jgi:hypothetical protein